MMPFLVFLQLLVIQYFLSSASADVLFLPTNSCRTKICEYDCAWKIRSHKTRTHAADKLNVIEVVEASDFSRTQQWGRENFTTEVWLTFVNFTRLSIKEVMLA